MREVSVNVRALVEFSCLTGDIVPAGRALRRMREGAQAHAALQRRYGGDWRSEVAVSRTEAVCDLLLTVQGRIDGLGADEFGPVIEEIKSTEAELPPDFAGAEVHWMQAIVYAAIVARRDGADSACVRLVYVRGGDALRLTRRMTAQQLEQTFFELAEAYAAHQVRLLEAGERARRSAQALPFPYDGYRAGQRALVKHAYFALTHGRRLIAQAPTGIGKTMAALYPAVRALGGGAVERIFYLTARTTQRRAAEEALALLRARGLHLRSVTITAKDRICFCPGAACSADACPYAKGYFDRIRAALEDGLNEEDLSRAGVEALARRHEVCPFELSLDLAEQAEAVICDYNYAFDPNVRLRRFFEGRSHGGALLIDEAHNLPSRVCDMLSAELDTARVREARRLCGKRMGRKCAAYAALTALLRALEAEGRPEGADAPAGPPFCADNASDGLREAAALAAEALREMAPHPDPAVNDLFFALLDFDRAARQAAPEHSCALIEPRKGGCRVKLWRFDPSQPIADTLKKGRGALLFSATLTPLSYYAHLCGLNLEGEDAALSVPGPFPPENRLVLRAAVPMRYGDRERSLPALADYLRAMIDARVGNYLACCPSYALLERVADAFEALCPEVCVLRQRPSMGEEERAALLAALPAHPQRTTLAFVAMGGVFTEGVDLPGDRLSGAAILSVGIPQISFERDTLARRPPPTGGYDMAYVYPSVARVAQAAGRVIRTESDRGVILLLDDRFGRQPYRALYAELWSAEPVESPQAAQRRMGKFWAAGENQESKKGRDRGGRVDSRLNGI